MEKRTQLGANRTGIDMSPIDSKEMARGAMELTPQSPASSEGRSRIEQQYLREAGMIGSVPVPGTLKGALKSTMDKVAGRNPEVLIDKLGERLAFERTGVRLYEAVMRKCENIAATGESLPFSLGDLQHIRDEEFEHFQMLKQCMRDIGADPTAMTPDADVSAVASMGIQRVLNDPRTSITQSLEMLVNIELLDNAEWEMLIELTEDMGMDDMAKQFGDALRQENEHEQMVRSWYRQALKAELGKSERSRH